MSLVLPTTSPFSLPRRRLILVGSSNYLTHFLFPHPKDITLLGSSPLPRSQPSSLERVCIIVSGRSLA